MVQQYLVGSVRSAAPVRLAARILVDEFPGQHEHLLERVESRQFSRLASPLVGEETPPRVGVPDVDDEQGSSPSRDEIEPLANAIDRGRRLLGVDLERGGIRRGLPGRRSHAHPDGEQETNGECDDETTEETTRHDHRPRP